MLLADEVATHQPVLNDTPYQPHLARIVRIEKMIENTQVFTLRFLDEHLVRSFRHQPGQFVMLSIPGPDLLLAAGGLGMAPLRSLLWYALDHRDQFNNLILMYGSKRPEDMLFRQ